MAEAAGLALGGIALVSLVSTCVEILEYVESAKSLARDFRLASTQVSLIKQRLQDWGAAMSTLNDTCSPADHVTPPPTYRPACGGLMEETLRGIRDLLDQTSRMSRRHSLGGKERQQEVGSAPEPPSKSPSFSSLSSLSSSTEASCRPSRPRRPQILTPIRLKVIWVFQDKKKFENVIGQLDFLLSYLEKISEPLQNQPQMARNQSHSTQGWEKAGYPVPFPRNTDTTVDLAYHPNDIQENGGWVGSVADPPNDRCREVAGSLAALGPYPSPYANHMSHVALPPDHRQGPTEHGERRWTPGRSVIHVFRNNQSFDDATNMQGDLGIVPQGVQGHGFENCHARDDSLVMLGTINMADAHQILRDKWAVRNKEKKTERRAGRRKILRGGIHKCVERVRPGSGDHQVESS